MTQALTEQQQLKKDYAAYLYSDKQSDEYVAFLETATGLTLVYKNGTRMDPPPDIINAPAIVTYTTIVPMNPGQSDGQYVAGNKTSTILGFRQQWDVRTQKHVDNGYVSKGPAIKLSVSANGTVTSKCFPPATASFSPTTGVVRCSTHKS